MTIPRTTIYYTKTDEAPALATRSFVPIVRGFTRSSGLNIELVDISLAGRILDAFPECLTEEQRRDDTLAKLGKICRENPQANILKLPNISASIPQLKAAIKELQKNGYKIPDFPEDPQDEAEEAIRARYAKVTGSAVNPVLREGNSDRRVARPVKQFAKENPHSMGDWSDSSKSHVATMQEGCFLDSERTHVMKAADTVSIVHIADDGTETVLKSGIELEAGEVIDAAFTSCKELISFFEQQIADAKEQDVLCSLHMKATMMKVSDPIVFGHMVKVFYQPVLKKFASELKEIGFNPNNGIGDLYAKLCELPGGDDGEKANEIKSAIKALYSERPRLAMVDSDKGITNLHVPSDVIIDASMPAAIRTSGMMWGPDGNLADMKAIIPERSYSGIYQATINFCRKNGAFDVTTMGNVCNVGLMAKKAEEYGSHDKTFELQSAGKTEVRGSNGTVLLEHKGLQAGDIWRMCQTKDEPIRDWIKLAAKRAKKTGDLAIFWLDQNRAHDAALIKMVEEIAPSLDFGASGYQILSPTEATELTCKRCKDGLDTISVTGNVLRDYLTDLFPILELGTSAKMLSIVPLLKGGGLFETGAGGSAPKHVQQFIEENHLRWDSLGEFLAVAVSLEEQAEKTGNEKLAVVASALHKANERFLAENKSPSRKVNELDNRGSHFYLALYWAKALATQDVSKELKAQFATIAAQLTEKEGEIVQTLNDVQGSPVDIDGYYLPSEEKVEAAMRPSETFNAIINTLLLA